MSKTLTAALLAFVLAPCARPHAAHAQTVVQPDTDSISPQLLRDTLVQSIYVGYTAILDVRVERPSTGVLAGIFGGRYLVQRSWPGPTRFLTADTTYGGFSPPVLVLTAFGEPSVVVFASYIGGEGREPVRDYRFKVLVLEAGSVRWPGSTKTFSLKPPLRGWSTATVTSFTRLPHGGFVFQVSSGPTVRYEQGTLTWYVTERTQHQR